MNLWKHIDDNLQPHRVHVLFFALIAAVSFLPFLGANPLFDWDEVNFAEVAREMMETGDYMTVRINFEAFWEKPPLFFWLQVLSMKIFGVNAFAARLPNALVGIVAMPSLYIIGTKLRGRRFGILFAGIYFGTLLGHLYFKSGIIDPLFNFFIFLGIVGLLKMDLVRRAKSGTGIKQAMFAAIFVGMATITKGPVAALMVGLTYVAYRLIYERKEIPWIPLLTFAGTYLLIPLAYFGSLVLFTEDGIETLSRFYEYHVALLSKDVAGHAQPFFYHFVVFLIGCFPMAAFTFRGMALRYEEDQHRTQKRLMLVWWWVVMIVFSLVRTKIIHYSSLLYYPGAYLAASYLLEYLEGKQKFSWDMRLIYGLGMVLFGLASSSLNLFISQLDSLVPEIKDEFTKGNLSLPVEWSGFEFLIGILFLSGTAAGFYFLHQRKVWHFLGTIMLTTGLFINGLNLFVGPKIAQYTQQSAVEFWQEKSTEDAYLIVAGYKSYAHLFYGNVAPYDKKGMDDFEFTHWLKNGEIDRDVYMAARKPKVTDQFLNEWHANFEVLYEKGGFVFFKRSAQP